MQANTFRNMLIFIYALSGMAALAYEVLWTRMLSLLFGVSIFGVVVTVSAFMAGLGCGSLLGVKLRCPARTALRWFALIEGCIALYALALPALMHGVDNLLDDYMVSGLAGWFSMQGIASFTLLYIPAFGMGAGFPLILKVAVERSSLGAVYGMNTMGGILGALLPLILLPAFGWSESVRIVAVISMIVCAGAWLLSGYSGMDETHEHRGKTSRRPPMLTLFAYAGIGAASLTLEVAWTRLYGMLMLRTEYVLAVILAIFLAGIAMGSLWARRADPSRILCWMPALAAFFTLLSLYELPWLARWAESMHATSLYGAMLAGFVLLPALGTAGTLCSAAITLFLCGMIWVKQRSLWLALPLICLMLWPVQRLPEASILLPQELAGGKNIMVFEDAVSITHVVALPNGQRLLLSDLHRMDASTDPTAIAVQKNQARLPLLLHPHPKSILLLGLGTGITASASLALSGLTRTAVELSAGAIMAADTRFDPVNGGVMQRIKVVRDDARRFLRITPEHYDIILGDLFHPDMVGRSALLSIQQFERGRSKLNTGGLYVQWLALNQFDVPSLKTVLSSFRKVFPQGQMFVDGFRLALVGIRNGLISVPSLHSRFVHLDKAVQGKISGNEGIWTWLGRYWGIIPKMARYGRDMRLTGSLKWLLDQRIRPAMAMRQLHIVKSDSHSFMRAYAASSLNMQLELASLSGHEAQAQQLARLAYQANPRDRWSGFALADRMYATLADAEAYGYNKEKALKAVLSIRPDHIEALKSLLRLTLEQSAMQRNNSKLAGHLRQRILELSPLDSDVAGMTQLDAGGRMGLNP